MLRAMHRARIKVVADAPVDGAGSVQCRSTWPLRSVLMLSLLVCRMFL